MQNELGRWCKNLPAFFAFETLKAWLFQGLLLLAAISAVGAARADIQYVYDEAGRLSQTIAPDGGSAYYHYDDDGNILAITRLMAGELALLEFTPNSAPAGAVVTLWGSGFDPSPEGNTVKFNSTTTAGIVSASANKLVVNVPADAISGPISVTTSAGTAVSSEVFTVEDAQVGLAITGFTPNIGVAGTPVTINGRHFDTFLANNRVQFNGMLAPVSAATDTTLQTKVPESATSGPISVTTLNGTAISADDFFVPPPGSNASGFAVTGRIIVDGTSLPVSLTTAGKGALIIFSGVAGQRIGLGISALTLTPSAYASLTISVLKPDGTVLTNCNSYTSAGGRCVLAPLPADGTYTIRAIPSSGVTANVTLTLSSDMSGTLAAGEPAVSFATTRVGQNARYSFTADARQNFAFLFNEHTFSGATVVYVDKPDGTQLTAMSVSGASKTLNLANLPVAGIYTMRIVPSGTATGSLTVALKNASLPLAVDGDTLQDSLPYGQYGYYIFNGNAGQRLGLGISALTLTPSTNYASLTIAVLKPDGTVLTNCYSYNAAGGRCALAPLPADGTYTIQAMPNSDSVTANVTLTLSSDVSGTLVAGEPALTYATTRIGQNARYTFSAATRQNLSLLFSGNTFATSVSVYVDKPDGTIWTSTAIGSANTTLNLSNLPMSGNYAVRIVPSGKATGSLTVALKNASLPLAVDGDTLQDTLPYGQYGYYTFNGSAGQRLGLGISGLTLTPSAYASLVISVLKPDGTVLTNCNSYTAVGDRCALAPLPIDGTYTIRAMPNSSSVTANVTLILSSDVSGTLVAGEPALTYATARIGQNASYTFTGMAGQNLALLFAGNTFTGTTTAYIDKPDGTLWTSMTIGSANTILNLSNLPMSGNYVVRIVPSGKATGSLTVTLKNASLPLAVDGDTLQDTLPYGQYGYYTFNGSAGQRLGLGISGLTLTPSAYASLTIAVLKPDGTVLTNCNFYTVAGGRCALAPLPADGTYTIRAIPNNSGVTANVTLTLSSDVSGTLVAGEPALTYATTRIGQNTRYAFSAETGQSLSLLFSGSTFAATFSIYIDKPDGTLWMSTAIGSAAKTVSLTNLPVSGDYSVRIVPTGTATGQLNVTLQ